MAHVTENKVGVTKSGVENALNSSMGNMGGMHEGMKHGMGPMMGMHEGMKHGMQHAMKSGMMEGASHGVAASAGAGKSMLKKFVTHPATLIGLGVVVGYLVYKYRKNIIEASENVRKTASDKA
ncbi:hypothetical protein [Methylomarinum vadi]|uniref:hypothetical protein n=1 Tax=Methylomarinum vadi TaxID=438855 RepID=UPI0004DF7174|nr:hypothetical protein [Methylomarinum vadi]